MIIVEGPDGSGKTSLITMLAEKLDFEVMPRACTSDNGVDPATLKEWVNRDLSLPIHQPKFYDRHPLISEPIYGPLIRGHMADGWTDVGWLASRLNILRIKEPFFIFCLPPMGAVLYNIAEEHGYETKHLRGIHTHGRALYEMYCMRAAQEISYPFTQVWVWDYTTATEASFNTLVLECKGHI
jgi:hypothetical protein